MHLIAIMIIDRLLKKTKRYSAIIDKDYKRILGFTRNREFGVRCGNTGDNSK